MSDRIAQFQSSKSRAQRLAVLTAYDFPTARLLDEAGVDMLLVGDSVGMVVLGYPDTTLVTMEEMIHHTRAVARGVAAGTGRAIVMSDLPFGAAETPEMAVRNGLLLMEAGAHCVKVEGGASHAAHIAAMRDAGVPAMAHIGMQPQRVRIEGGYKIKGKTPEQASGLIADARAAEAAGAFAVLMELVVPAVAKEVTASIGVPTIGIGSGEDCDGQVLVIHDLIGLFPWFTPKFATPRASVAAEITRAAKEFVDSVKAGAATGNRG